MDFQDELPQPYRFVQQVVNGIFQNMSEEISKSENKKLLEKSSLKFRESSKKEIAWIQKVYISSISGLEAVGRLVFVGEGTKLWVLDRKEVLCREVLKMKIAGLSAVCRGNEDYLVAVHDKQKICVHVVDPKGGKLFKRKLCTISMKDDCKDSGDAQISKVTLSNDGEFLCITDSHGVLYVFRLPSLIIPDLPSSLKEAASTENRSMESKENASLLFSVNPPEQGLEPVAFFLNNESLSFEAKQINEVFKLYNQAEVAKRFTYSIILYWKNYNVIRSYVLQKSTFDEFKEWTLLSPITTATVNPHDSEEFCVGLENGNVILWNARKSCSFLQVEFTDAITSVSFTTNKQLITASSSTIEVIDLNDFKTLSIMECYKDISQVLSIRDTPFFVAKVKDFIDLVDLDGQIVSCFNPYTLDGEYIYDTTFQFVVGYCNVTHCLKVFDLLEAVTTEYPQIEALFPSVHHSEKSAQQVFKFLCQTKHADRNLTEKINEYLSTPAFGTAPLQSHKSSSIISGSRQTTRQTNRSQKSAKSVRFAGRISVQHGNKIIGLASLSNSDHLGSHYVKRTKNRIELTRLERRKRERLKGTK